MQVQAEIARVEPINGGAIQQTEVGAFIQQAIASKLDPAALEKLYDLYEREKKSNAAAAFNAALSKFQHQCPKIFKRRSTATHDKGFAYNYANLFDIDNDIDEAMHENGLAATFGLKKEDGVQYVVCFIRHAMGHVDDSGRVPFAQDSGSMNGLQKVGSGLTYCQRYAKLMGLGIATGRDLDGHEPDEPPRGQSTLTQEQADSLNDLIIQSQSDAGKFLSFFKVRLISDLPASQFNRAVKMLNDKIKAGAR